MRVAFQAGGIQDVIRPGDFCFANNGDQRKVVMSCPDCGEVAVLPHKVSRLFPLTLVCPGAEGTILDSAAFPCGHLFFIRDGEVEPVEKTGIGTLAVCNRGFLGMITKPERQEVEYPDKTKGFVWVGIHLTGWGSYIGAPWSSRSPKVVGQIYDVESFLKALRAPVERIAP